jgi:hypothetical protein
VVLELQQLQELLLLVPQKEHLLVQRQEVPLAQE